MMTKRQRGGPPATLINIVMNDLKETWQMLKLNYNNTNCILDLIKVFDKKEVEAFFKNPKYINGLEDDVDDFS